MRRMLMAARPLVMLLAFAWLMTHDGCAHPVGNALALVLFLAAGTSLLLPHAVEWAERNLTQGN